MLINSFKWSPIFWKEFNEKIPMPKYFLEGQILAQPRTKNYALVGTAFDYIFSWHIERRNRKVLRTGWIDPFRSSSKVLDKIEEECDCDEGYPEWFPALHLCDKIQSILSKAKELRSKFLANGKLTNSILKIALSLAQLEGIYHSINIRGEDDWRKLESVIMQLGCVEASDIIDLRRLISITDWDLFKAKRICIIHPILRHGVADLLIDNKIIEIKTTRNLKISRNDFNQLVAYYFSSTKYRTRQTPRKSHKVDTVCIYFSRFAYFHQMDARYIIKKSDLPRLAKWFERKIFR